MARISRGRTIRAVVICECFFGALGWLMLPIYALLALICLSTSMEAFSQSLANMSQARALLQHDGGRRA